MKMVTPSQLAVVFAFATAGQDTIYATAKPIEKIMAGIQDLVESLAEDFDVDSPLVIETIIPSINDAVISETSDLLLGFGWKLLAVHVYTEKSSGQTGCVDWKIVSANLGNVDTQIDVTIQIDGPRVDHTVETKYATGGVLSTTDAFGEHIALLGSSHDEMTGTFTAFMDGNVDHDIVTKLEAFFLSQHGINAAVIPVATSGLGERVTTKLEIHYHR